MDVATVTFFGLALTQAEETVQSFPVTTYPEQRVAILPALANAGALKGNKW
jgi:hypothetical protein